MIVVKILHQWAPQKFYFVPIKDLPGDADNSSGMTMLNIRTHVGLLENPDLMSDGPHVIHYQPL